MLAIVLDDLPCRHDAFDKAFKHVYQDIIHTYNFADFFHAVTTIPAQIDYVSLDHDLGDHTYHGTPTGQILYGTGTDAVRLLEILPVEMRPVKVNVHSFNFVRSEVMVERLKVAGYDTTEVRFTDE